MASRAAIAVETQFSRLRLSGELIPADTLPYGSLKGFQGSEHCFTYRLAPYHAFSVHASQEISRSYHPGHYHTKHSLVNKSVNKACPLWISVLCAKLNGGNKRVLRSHMVRRIRAAVTESLNKHGYDFSGKRIIAAGTEKVGQGEDLFGTMVLSAREPALTAKIDVVREQAGQAVSKMIEVSLQRSKRGDSNTHQGWGRHKKPSGFNQVRRVNKRKEN